MKIFLIILGCLVGLIILWVLFALLADKNAAKFARKIKPLQEWIRIDRFMGIRLLDDWEDTLSRMHHLGLITLNDLEEQKLAYQGCTKDIFTFTTTINDLRNIDHITFNIYKGKLSCIGITLKVDNGMDIDDFKRFLYAEYSKSFGKPTRVMVGYVFGEIDGPHLVMSTDYDSITIGIPKRYIG